MEILLLQKNADEIAVVREAMRTEQLTVVAECRDVLAFLRREGPYACAPRPDLILLDIDLSIVEDCEVLTDLKKDPKLKRIPVVVLASSDEHEYVFQAYQLYANAYIKKPADRKEFIAALRSTLQFWSSLVRLPRG